MMGGGPIYLAHQTRRAKLLPVNSSYVLGRTLGRPSMIPLLIRGRLFISRGRTL